jgi:hypothetical protein
MSKNAVFEASMSTFRFSRFEHDTSPPFYCHEMDLQAAFAFRRCKIFMLPFWKEVRKRTMRTAASVCTSEEIFVSRLKIPFWKETRNDVDVGILDVGRSGEKAE